MAEVKKKPKRKLYFRILTRLMRIKYKEPRFVYLGEPFTSGALILSNHEGTDAPMSLEIYCDTPVRMWGSYEMNAGLVKLYKYQTRIYYHEKKHWNLHLARLFCLIASPLTWLFYSGFDLISIYRGTGLVRTMRESTKSIANGDNVVIFPEDSSKGYLAELEGFHSGFVLLAELCYKKGIDVPIYVSYYRKSDRTYVFDTPVKYSELLAQHGTRADIAAYLCNRCNELGKWTENENTPALV